MLHRANRDQDPHGGKWNGLGGKLRPGETPEECAVREVREESGLTISNPSLRGILTFPAFQNEEDWYVYVFVASHPQGELVESEEGRLAWVEDHKVCELELWEGDPIFLQWLEEGRFFSAKFVYQNGKFVSYNVVFHPPTQKWGQTPIFLKRTPTEEK